MHIADGETDPWWRWNSAAIYPEGPVSIGASSCNVATVYAGNVVIGGQDAATKAYVTWANLPDRPSWLGNLSSVEVGPSMLPVEATNTDLGVSNSVTPIATDMYNLGQNGLRYRNVYSKRAVVDVVATAGSNLFFGGLTMPDATTTP